MPKCVNKPTLKCIGCKNEISQEEHLSCSLCESKYDLLCANISAERYRLMDKDKFTWRCPECHSKQPKVDNTNTPIRCPTPSEQIYEELITPSEMDMSYNVTHRRKPGKTLKPEASTSEIQLKADLFEADPLDVLTKQEISLFWKELRAARIEMSNFRTSVAELTLAINKSNERTDALEARMDHLEAQLNAKDRSDMETLEVQIDQLKQELQAREQDLLSNDIEIAGIPETTGEGITHIVLAVATKLGVQLEERDIVDASRVGAPRALVEGGPAPRPRNIAVRMTRRSSRDALLKAARVRRGATTADMGISGPPCKFYINERLTKLNRQLFQRAREIAKRIKWRFVWTRSGKIYVKKENGSKGHLIRSEADLVKVFGDDVVGSET